MRKPTTAKEQAVRLARMMTVSTGVTPAGFVKVCRTILRDSRSDDFREMYGEPPADGARPAAKCSGLG
jgi:hypothetical protein